MVCPYCNADTRVINSRHKKSHNIVWRRRQCRSCGSIITSEETVRYDRALMVRRPDDSLMPLERDRLLISIYRSIAHRPAATTDAAALTETVIVTVRKAHPEPVIALDVLRACTLDVLRRFDSLGHQHYQAYHPVA